MIELLQIAEMPSGVIVVFALVMGTMAWYFKGLPDDEPPTAGGAA